MGEDLFQRAPVLRNKAIVHHRKRHRLDIGAQVPQLVAVLLRKDLGPVRENLPHLDEHGAQILEHMAQTARREIVPRLVFPHDADDLGDALAAAARCELDLLGGRHGLRLLGDHIDSARGTPRHAQRLLDTFQVDGVFGAQRLRRCGGGASTPALISSMFRCGRHIRLLALALVLLGLGLLIHDLDVLDLDGDRVVIDGIDKVAHVRHEGDALGFGE